MNILLQGAMDEEINVFCEYYKPQETKVIKGYEFFIAKNNDNNIIISKTQKGIINATISTILALTTFDIDIVINQGCAGSHREDFVVGDIVIGKSAVYINDFKSATKKKGEGSNSLDWSPNKKRSYEIPSTKELVELAKKVEYKGNVFLGKLGSGDLHSKEYDRIKYLRSLFGEDCEDMETIASLKVCESFDKQRLSIRVISNNDLISQEFDKSQCVKSQKFVIEIVDSLISKKKGIKIVQN